MTVYVAKVRVKIGSRCSKIKLIELLSDAITLDMDVETHGNEAGIESVEIDWSSLKEEVLSK